jgi:hypothetical protein
VGNRVSEVRFGLIDRSHSPRLPRSPLQSPFCAPHEPSILCRPCNAGLPLASEIWFWSTCSGNAAANRSPVSAVMACYQRRHRPFVRLLVLFSFPSVTTSIGWAVIPMSICWNRPFNRPFNSRKQDTSMFRLVHHIDEHPNQVIAVRPAFMAPEAADRLSLGRYCPDLLLQFQ